MQKILNIIPAIALAAILQGCFDKEGSARELYNEAFTLEQEGMYAEAKDIYKKIVADYPSTEAATDANKSIAAIDKPAKIKAIYKQELLQALEMYRLDNRRYPTTQQGLKALIIEHDSALNWSGPYTNLSIYVIDQFDYRNYGASGIEIN